MISKKELNEIEKRAAREDIPKLVQEIRRLQKENEALKKATPKSILRRLAVQLNDETLKSYADKKRG